MKEDSSIKAVTTKVFNISIYFALVIGSDTSTMDTSANTFSTGMVQNQVSTLPTTSKQPIWWRDSVEKVYRALASANINYSLVGSGTGFGYHDAQFTVKVENSRHTSIFQILDKIVQVLEENQIPLGSYLAYWEKTDHVPREKPEDVEEIIYRQFFT
jgi:hypothetical protein